jgi:aminoglycoside phosphotransferase (APT) family kinase protein
MGFGLSEKWYREVKPGPDPTIEFIVSWLHRHVPTHRRDTSWIHFDAGQFLHTGNRVTALMDVEFSCIGDPFADLGAMRMRDTAQPIGDLTRAFAAYADESGQPIDRGVVNFHAVRFALLTAMLSAGTRYDPPPEFDLAQWQAWSLMSLMICLEIIAEQGGYHLDPPSAVAYPPTRNDASYVAVQRILGDVLTDLVS